MAANIVQFTATPGISFAQVSTANTNRDGTGTVATINAGSATGRRIGKITVKAVGTTTAGMIRFYLYDGTNTRMFREVTVSAITPGASTQTFVDEKTYFDQDAPILPNATWELRASTHNAETFNIISEYADF